MRRVRTGDAAAFGELVGRYRPSALRIATIVLGEASGADDVVQDASINAWRSRSSIDPDRPFRPWYLRVVANAAKNTRRGWGRRARLELRVAAMAPDPVRPDPESEAITESERELVLAALNQLGRDDRLVIALRYFEHMTEAEMAHALDCPAGTVKSRLSRALERLRHHLSEEDR